MTDPQGSLFTFHRVGDVELPRIPEGETRTMGPAYDPSQDRQRLQGQMERVFRLMRDGRWRTLNEIAEVTGDPPASISAQLRHLRKPRFGKWPVEKRRVEGGLWAYRLVVCPQVSENP